MGEVWSATDTRLDRQVAIKVLRSGLAADPAVRLRFESEARSAARLHHRNVVAVFDAGSDAGDTETAQLWLVMERLPGPTLADSMARGPLSPTEVRAVATDVLAGLSAAHEARLAHRDIKPSNLLQAGDGSWKIADFGIAKPLDSALDLTATGATIGTPSYLSPEQLEGRAATPASDLWAVGVVLYEALAGSKPFVGDTPFAVAHAIRSGEPAAIATLRPDVDPALSSAIAAALSKEPARRPHDAAAMASMLQGAAATTAAGPATSPEAATEVVPTTLDPPPVAPSGSSRPLLGWITGAVIVLAAIAVIVLAATGWFSSGPSRKDPSTTTTTTDGSSTTARSTTASTAASTTSTATTPPTTVPTSAPPTTTLTTAPTTAAPPTSSVTTASTSSTTSTSTSTTTTTTTTTSPACSHRRRPAHGSSVVSATRSRRSLLI